MRLLTCGRQRGANWRNDGPGAAAPAGVGRIGAGDAVDREYEVSNPNPRTLAQVTFHSNLCKNSTVPRPVQKPHDASNLAQVETLINLLEMMLNLGNVDLPVLLLHGRSEEMTKDSTLAILLQLDHLEVLHHGQEIVLMETITVVETLTTAEAVVINTKAATMPLHLLPKLAAIPHPGLKLLLLILLLPQLDMVVTLHQAIPVATLLSSLWVLHLASLLLLG